MQEHDSIEVIKGQTNLPLAIVAGQALTTIPEGLYIPPGALRIFLESFEGPLDLLLYLIRRQNLNILDLPVAKIAEQYMHYIGAMEEMELDLIGEYLLMSAMLAEIKSRMLLPRPTQDDVQEEDTRVELVRCLLEYQRFKKAAEDIDMLPRVDRDSVIAEIDTSHVECVQQDPIINLQDILISFHEVLQRMELRRNHQVQKEPLSVRERMTIILSLLAEGKLIAFNDCFRPDEGKAGAVVTLLSILQMLHSGLIEAIQAVPYSQIYIRSIEQ